MENLESKGVLGSFKLSENVISTIVATATTEVSGVACMASFEPNFKNISAIKNILNRDIAQKSTNIKFSEGALSVDLCVKVFFGTNLKEVAHKIQENVKEAIQNMTSLVVANVNVTIAGLFIENDDECACDKDCDCGCKSADQEATELKQEEGKE